MTDPAGQHGGQQRLPRLLGVPVLLAGALAVFLNEYTVGSTLFVVVVGGGLIGFGMLLLMGRVPSRTKPGPQEERADSDPPYGPTQ